MFRPIIKCEHWPVRHGDDSVRIGGVIPGIAKNMPDPDGWVWALLGLLDGTRTVDQVAADLVHRFPTKSEAAVRTETATDVDTLVKAGYIENAAELPPDDLSAGERERYSRGLALWRWMDLSPRRSSWDIQLQLRQARVVVIGIGGVGTTVTLSLTQSGVGELHLVEPDLVEMSNLNRQVLFTERDVGRPKVEVALERLRDHNSDISITGEATTITGPPALAVLAARFDVVVLTADQPQEIRSWTNQACVQTGTAWVHGGYHGPRINVGIYLPGTGPCYDCAYVADRERQTGLPPRTPAPYRRARSVHPANAISAGIAGQRVAHAAMRLITGVPSLPVNKEYGTSLFTLEDSVIRCPTSPHPACPTCGPQSQGRSATSPQRL